jgi:hypothetical protein
MNQQAEPGVALLRKNIFSKTFKNPQHICIFMSKKAGIRTSLMFLLVASLVVFAVGSLVVNIRSENKITGESITVNAKNTIRVPDSNQPLPNPDEGTIVLWTKPPVEIFSQFSDARDYIIFFTATNVPGLRVVYNIKEKRFEAGTPLLTSPQIDIFDGQNHQLAYTYKKGLGQKVFLDGVEVASSDFRPMKISQVTGFAFAVQSAPEAEIAGAAVVMYDHYLTQDDLARI